MWRSGNYAAALIVAATDDNGIVQAIQRIYLDANAQPLVLGNKKKTTNGSLDGCAVRLPGPADKPLLLAEGPETGLSVWAATGYETWVSLGAVGKLTPPQGRRLVICRDDDAPQSPADKALSRTVTEWRKQGINATIATPWHERRGDGSDFNDVIKDGDPAPSVSGYRRH